jgi:maltooligosyltrehalose trehalohydrolase
VEAFVLDGAYSAYRGRRHGTPAGDLGADRCVVCVQNHDQVGNRARGERLSALVPFEALKLAAGFLLLPPYLPMLFMGEEYGETAPFLFFTSHRGEELAQRVREGRRAGFSPQVHAHEVPDPQSRETFERSRIDFGQRELPGHRELLQLYRELLSWRRTLGARGRLRAEDVLVLEPADAVAVTLPAPRTHQEFLTIFHFGASPSSASVRIPEGRWQRRWDSSDRRWAGPGSLLPDQLGPGATPRLELNPYSFGVFERAG